MHYHVMSGQRGARVPTTVLRFADRMEGIISFIKMAKITWSHLETPPQHEEIRVNDNISIIRMRDKKYRLVFVYCNHDNCDEDDPLQLKIRL